MESISIFSIYKISVGPSSSHTLGPWKAALDFREELIDKKIDHLKIELYGSLSKTGKGHCTDFAIQLGLENYQPETIPTNSINSIIKKIKENQSILLNDQVISFNPDTDIVYHDFNCEAHPNTLKISAHYEDSIVSEQVYYSLGGGFISKKGEKPEDSGSKIELPFPIQNSKDLIQHTHEYGMSISDVVMENEHAFHSDTQIHTWIDNIFNTMKECVYRGCMTGGILPGGLNVKRRAKKLASSLLDESLYTNMDEWYEKIKESKKDFNTINKWISTFALAVNEENADLGRVVTSPTNGASGVIPAVLLYFHLFYKHDGMKDVERFLLTSGEIGCIFKKGATISAAVGGCQAEIGVSSAMAAAGLTEVLGGTPKQVAMAAEIAMEHHLGLTCDPIGGLVQIPCIERNAMGAMKAITASNLALAGNPTDAKVDLDEAVKTMWETAQGMNAKFKETSEGGLAVNVAVIYPEC